MIPIGEITDGVVFNIRVIPRSSRCELVGIQGDALKIKITAPPVEGAANEECIRFLSDIFSIRRSQIRIVAGHQSKNKRVAISGIKKEAVEGIL